jgi:hypothetical protein
MLEPFLSGERGPDLHGVFGRVERVGPPPGGGRTAPSCADSINLLDNQPATADRSVSEKPRPSALAREALLTDYASAQVSRVRWSGVYCGPSSLRCASAGAWHRWHNWHSGMRRDSLRPRAYRVSAVLCRVEHMGTSGAGLVAQRGSQRPEMAIRRHGIASAQAICPSKPSVLAMSR